MISKRYFPRYSRLRLHLIGILIVLSILSFSVFVVFWFKQSSRQQFNDNVVVSPQNLNSDGVVTPTTATKQPPTRINIPKLSKNLPIQAALVKDNNWQMFDKAVAWLSTSSVPGEGNVILYAHNWKSLWADLYTLIPGDTIEIEQNQKILIYKVFESRAVKPTDIESILSTDNILTLYTCEGSFDQKRRVVFAKPSN